MALGVADPSSPSTMQSSCYPTWRAVGGFLTLPCRGRRDQAFYMNLRELRLARGWSQEHLAEVSGLSVRTIQRIENGGPPGLASRTALRRTFGADIDQVIAAQEDVPIPTPPTSFVDTIRTCLGNYAEFDGRAGRAEYWWFFLFVLLTTSVGALLDEALGAVALLVLALPLVAVGARRLRDAGQSPWWQLLALAPFGGVVPLIILTFPPVPLRDPAPTQLR
jgi:transcriptional regulator with XRE-family HTH domain